MAGRAGGLALLATLFVLFTGCSKDPLPGLLTQADNAVQSGDLHAAAVYYGTAVSQAPRHAFARWRLANVLLALGEGNAAEEHVRAAALLGIDEGRVRPALAEALFLQGRHTEVTALSLDGLADTPAATVMAFQSRASIALGRPGEGESLATRALKLSRYSADAVFAVAIVALSRHDWESAEAELDRLDLTEAGYPYAAAARAEIARLVGDNALSRELLSRITHPSFAHWRGPNAVDPAVVNREAVAAADADPATSVADPVDTGVPRTGSADRSHKSPPVDPVDLPGPAPIAASEPAGPLVEHRVVEALPAVAAVVLPSPGPIAEPVAESLAEPMAEPAAEPAAPAALAVNDPDPVDVPPAETGPIASITEAPIAPTESVEQPTATPRPAGSGQWGDAGSGPAAETGSAGEPVEQFVRAWAADWSRQDVAAYLARYAADFRPADGMSRKAWVKQRRVRLTRPSEIAVRVSAMEVQASEAGQVRVSFEQAYRANHYRDSVRKTLLLRNGDKGWEILSETSASPGSRNPQAVNRQAAR